MKQISPAMRFYFTALLTVLAMLAANLMFPVSSYAFGTNSPLPYAGATGQGTCSSCHGTLTAGSGVTLSSPPTTYTPGGKAVTLTVNIPASGGFELEVGTQIGNVQAGTLTAGTNSTVLVNGALQFATATVETTSWTLSWTPPATNVGPVEVWVTGGQFGANFSNNYIITPAVTATAPAITTQPANKTVTAGQTATFSVVASGTAPLTYQWMKSGTAMTGATSSSYTTAATTTTDSGSTFSVKVTNSAGSVTSSSATLTVNAAAVAPSITTQPASQTVTAGQTATFSVAASGTAPLTYQWMKSGTAMTGATSSSYTTAATTTADSGSTFSVKVTNSAGSVTSSSATLTVNAAAVAPSITTQPASQTVTAGQTATFSVVASGAAPLTYQWMKSGTAMTGATSSSYTTAATTTADSGSTFSVKVTNSAGSVTSSSATLTVNAAATPTLSASPSTLSFTYQSGVASSGTQSLMIGGTAKSFTATASGGMWLSVTPSGSVPGSATVTVNPGTLITGTYMGTVNIMSTGATSQTVNVTLTVTAATGNSSLSATPTSLDFTYQLGGSVPSAKSLAIGSTGSTPMAFTASYTGSSYISLSPTSGMTPGNISVSLTSLRRASAGTYNGNIYIKATGATTITVPVTLTITSSSGSGGGTSGTMYAQLHVYDTTSSGAVASTWVNHLGVNTQYNNDALVLSLNANAPAGSWAGANILNYTGTSLTELGFDIRAGSECTATSPRFIVSDGTTTYTLAGCSAGTIQTDVPAKGWNRVRFNLTTTPTLATPQITPGVQIKSISLVMDQAAGSATGTLGGLAVIDYIDVNGTLIQSGTTGYTHDE